MKEKRQAGITTNNSRILPSHAHSSCINFCDGADAGRIAPTPTPPHYECQQ